ncbi:MAG: glucosamine-6-phosphate deaminase, partial [Paludibacteraceae bacterium]|nr:glucosamine-6-phosphate deaminase [Paludibacteraceae bacterium]
MRNNLSQMISLSKVEEKLYRPANAYEQSRVTRLEHVNTTICETPREGIANVANRIARVIRDREANGKKTVLSLASGRSMRDLFV